MTNIEFNTSRVRVTQTFQHRPYQSMTIDVTVETAQHDATPETMVAEGVATIQAGFGKALWAILERYNDNRSKEELQKMVDAVIPPALKITLRDNEFVMDALLLEAYHRLEEKNNG